MILPDINLVIYAYNLREPWLPGEAVSHVGAWLSCPLVRLLHPGLRHLEILAGFAQAGLLSSALVTDAHLAALAIEHQATVYSNDGDFRRFPGLRHRNPLGN